MMIEGVGIEKAREFDIPHTKNSLFMLFKDKKKEVLFSFSRRGNAMDCHVASNKPGKLMTRRAVNKFCDVIFYLFPSVNKITGTIGKKSVINLLKKCGFNVLCHACVMTDKKQHDAVIMIKRRT